MYIFTISETGMSEACWRKTAARVNSFCQKILPSVDAMRVEKKILRVPIVVTEYDAIVPMKGLVQKTVDRLMEDPDLKKKIQELVELNDGRPIKIQFIFKVIFFPCLTQISSSNNIQKMHRLHCKSKFTDFLLSFHFFSPIKQSREMSMYNFFRFLSLKETDRLKSC